MTKVSNFEEFKRRWDRARAFNDKYAATEDAWIGYKVRNCCKFNLMADSDYLIFLSQKLFRLNYSPEEDARRFEYFRPNWEEVLAHNERYARGETYYSMAGFDVNWQLSSEECKKLTRKRPVRNYFTQCVRKMKLK